MRIAYGDESHPGEEAEIAIPLQDSGWYHVQIRPDIVDGVTRFRRTDYRGEPVTRAQMLEVLADIEHVLVRAQYHTEQIEGRYVCARAALLVPLINLNLIIDRNRGNHVRN